MSLSNEAAYLYVYAKELTKVNKKLKRFSKKAEKHAHKHLQATSEEKRHKHKKKHAQASSRIKSLMKHHNMVLRSLKHHYIIFAHTLQKEHKI